MRQAALGFRVYDDMQLSWRVGTSKGSHSHAPRHFSRSVHVIRRDYNRRLVVLMLSSSEGSQLPLMPYFVCSGLASVNLKAALQGKGFAPIGNVLIVALNKFCPSGKKTRAVC